MTFDLRGQRASTTKRRNERLKRRTWLRLYGATSTLEDACIELKCHRHTLAEDERAVGITCIRKERAKTIKVPPYAPNLVAIEWLKKRWI